MSKLVDLLKEEMSDQLDHVRELSEADSKFLSSDYVSGMRSGSDILLGIVESFFRKNEGTAGYLNLLDESQLAFALRHTKALISKKEDEDKIRIWTTENSDFWVLKKSVAVQELKDQVAAMDVDSDPDPDDFKIHTTLVRESELSQYLDPKIKILARETV